MAERVVPRGTLADHGGGSTDALLEAFIELARSAIANRREAGDRRRTIRVVETRRKPAA